MNVRFVEEIYDIHSAAFQTDDLLLLTGDNGDCVEPKPHLAGYRLSEKKLLFLKRLEAIPGTIMPVDDKYVLGFYGHPKLFEIQSGRIVQE